MIAIRRVAVLAAVVAACLGLFIVSPALAQDGPRSISGKVVQGTAGARLPEGLQVVLLSIDEATGAVIEQKSVAAGPDGGFRFDDLLAGPDVNFRVAASTPGRYAPSLDLSQEADWSALELTVFERTTSLDDIAISSMVTLVATVDRRSRSVGVLTVANIENRSDRIWEPDLDNPAITGLDLIRFSLPKGFSDLTMESDLPAGDLLPIDTGVAITNPVPPGEYSILMTYVARYEEGRLDFPTRLPFGADLFRIMAPEGSAVIAGEGIGAPEAVVVNDQQYMAAEARDLARGATLDLRLEKLPQPNIGQSVADFFEGRTYVLVIIWVVAVALLGVLAYAFLASRGGRRPALAAAGGTVVAEDPAAARHRIVGEIAALDDEHAAGRVPDQDYQKRRDELKAQALKAAEDAARSQSSG